MRLRGERRRSFRRQNSACELHKYRELHNTGAKIKAHLADAQWWGSRPADLDERRANRRETCESHLRKISPQGKMAQVRENIRK